MSNSVEQKKNMTLFFTKIISTKRLYVENTVCSNFYNLQKYLNQFIQKSKQNYLNKVVEKLSALSTSTKCYWSLLKTLLNEKKIPCIPPNFTITSTLLILKKRMRSSTLWSELCPLIRNKVYYRHNRLY